MAELSFTPVMSLANSAKAQKGNELHRALEEILYDEEREGRIVSYSYKYTVGRPGCSSGQFYAPFMIQFADGDRWLIFSTSVLRDRIKMDQWDAFNIKAIDSRVTRAYLVYPPPPEIEEKDIRAWVAKDRKYRNGEEFSYLDGLICRPDLVDLIREKADEYYNSLYPPPASMGDEGGGRYYDYIGHAFEREIAASLADENYLVAWKQGRQIDDRKFAHFTEMMDVFGLEAHRVVRIQATANHDDIGDLPSGGPPKTDVVAKVHLVGGTSVLKTISCKRPSGDSVTGHQYKAEDFARVLDPNNAILLRDLRYFQMAGNFSEMPEGAADELEREMAPYVERLCYWVVGGQGGDGEEHQKADYVVVYRPSDNAFAVHTVAAYVHWLMTSCSRKRGGTPFNWTYQGERGRNIQLKMPIML